MASYERGLYVCKITAQGFDESKEKKTPFFWLEFVPQGRLDPDNPNGKLYPCEDYVRNVRLWLTEKTVEQTVVRLRAMGWNGTKFQDLEPPNGHSFVGVEFRLECLHEQQGDKVYEKWEFPYEGAEQRHVPGMSRKIDALFGKALGKGPAKPPVQNPKPETVPPDDSQGQDDIPF